MEFGLCCGFHSKNCTPIKSWNEFVFFFASSNCNLIFYVKFSRYFFPFRSAQRNMYVNYNHWRKDSLGSKWLCFFLLFFLFIFNIWFAFKRLQAMWKFITSIKEPEWRNRSERQQWIGNGQKPSEIVFSSLFPKQTFMLVYFSCSLCFLFLLVNFILLLIRSGVHYAYRLPISKEFNVNKCVCASCASVDVHKPWIIIDFGSSERAFCLMLNDNRKTTVDDVVENNKRCNWPCVSLKRCSAVFSFFGIVHRVQFNCENTNCVCVWIWPTGKEAIVQHNNNTLGSSTINSFMADFYDLKCLDGKLNIFSSSVMMFVCIFFSYLFAVISFNDRM